MLQEYKEKPDYGRCVAIVASASLREMIKPGALAIVSPIVVGALSSVFTLGPNWIAILEIIGLLQNLVFRYQEAYGLIMIIIEVFATPKMFIFLSQICLGL